MKSSLAQLSLSLLFAFGVAAGAHAQTLPGKRDQAVLPVWNQSSGRVEALLLLEPTGPGMSRGFGGNVLDTAFGIGAGNSLGVFCDRKTGLASALGNLANNCMLASFEDGADSHASGTAAFQAGDSTRLGLSAGSGSDTLPAWLSSPGGRGAAATVDVNDLTVFAQHNIGADPADQVEEGDRLVDGGIAQRDFLGLFTGSTALNQVRKHVLDVRGGDITTTAFPDPEDPATFRYGLNLLPPVAPVAFAPANAPGRVGDLTRSIEQLDTTYWLSGGWIPDIASERAFDNFRGVIHPRLVPEAEYRSRVADRSNTVQLFALDRDLRLDSSYAFPPGWFMGTPGWIPKPGARSTREGWLVGPVWGPEEAHAEVWIFDTALALSAGPVCKLGPAVGELGLRPGFPLHGNWIDREGIEAWEHPEYRTEMPDVPTYVKLAELGVMSSSLVTRAAKQLFGA